MSPRIFRISIALKSRSQTAHAFRSKLTIYKNTVFGVHCWRRRHIWNLCISSIWRSLRAVITLSLIFALLAISGVGLYSAHGDFNKTKELLDKLLPALTGLIGSALGFYFGSKSSNA